MRLADLGPLPLTIIASLVVAVVLLAIRITVLQRMQQQRQRENRQETEPVDYQPLINELRSDLRRQLGLEPIPVSFELPAAGPSRTPRTGRGEGGGGGRAGGGGAGGMGGAAGAGGMSAGMIAADAMDHQPPP